MRCAMSMEIRYHYIKRDASESLEGKIQSKLARFEKYFRTPVTVDVTMKGEGKEHYMKMILSGNDHTFDGDSRKDDMYKNIDVCLSKLEVQIKKAKMEYRTDSKKVNEKVHFMEEFNAKSEFDQEDDGEE